MTFKNYYKYANEVNLYIVCFLNFIVYYSVVSTIMYGFLKGPLIYSILWSIITTPMIMFSTKRELHKRFLSFFKAIKKDSEDNNFMLCLANIKNQQMKLAKASMIDKYIVLELFNVSNYHDTIYKIKISDVELSVKCSTYRKLFYRHNLSYIIMDNNNVTIKLYSQDIGKFLSKLNDFDM